MWLSLLRLGACCCLGLVLSAVLAVLMLFLGAPVTWLGASGEPLARLALWLLPEAFWLQLTGLSDPLANASLLSFLALCAGLGQLALLAGLGLYRLWYRS